MNLLYNKALELDLHKLLPVLIGIHLVGIPLYPRLHILIIILLLTLTGWCYLIITKRIKQPSTFVRITTLIISITFLVTANGTIFGQQAGTSLLLLLALLKIFEVKSKRDINVIIFMSYFLIASNFFFSQSALMAVYVFIIVIYLCSILILLSDTLSTINFVQRIKYASKIVALAIPFMIILFILFPRIPSPLWGLPKDTLSAKTGLSEEMTLGNINKLVASGDVAFRAVFTGEPPPHSLLYWRGPVLTQFDGLTWRRSNAPDSALPHLVASENDANYQYSITLEPHNKNWLLSLEHPIMFDRNLRLSRELQLFHNKTISNIYQYTAVSSPTVINAGLFLPEHNRNLLLPRDTNPRTVALANRFYNMANGNPELIIQHIFNYFREENFYYTLTPPLLDDQPIDDFLFDTKKGFCGHYASAFVVLLRNAGIPSRVVTGYQGGKFNPVDNYMIVRQSDAHAWAEAWIEGKGWKRFDPTAAVAPSRIELGVTDAGLEESKLPAMLFTDNSLIQQSRYMLDSFRNSWNKWIIGYNESKQKQFFKSIGIDKINPSKLAIWLVLAMTITGALVAIVALRDSSNKNLNIILYYYLLFCAKCKKQGVSRHFYEGENDYLNRVKLALPDYAKQAQIITEHYQQIRYNNRSHKSYKNRFITAVKNFKPKKRTA